MVRNPIFFLLFSFYPFKYIIKHYRIFSHSKCHFPKAILIKKNRVTSDLTSVQVCQRDISTQRFQFYWVDCFFVCEVNKQKYSCNELDFRDFL